MIKFKNKVKKEMSPFLPPKITIINNNKKPKIVIALID